MKKQQQQQSLLSRIACYKSGKFKLNRVLQINTKQNGVVQK